MSIITAYINGNFGNQCMQILHGLAYAERHGCEFQLANVAYKSPAGKLWLGESIFDLNIPLTKDDLPDRNDPDGPHPLIEGETNIRLNGYRQYQDAVIYTAAQARKWFRFRPEVEDILASLKNLPPQVFHLRHGDFLDHGMIVVSRESYAKEAARYGYNPVDFETIEESTWGAREHKFPPELSFLADFYRLINANVLFRSNSTFAWTAALLNQHTVFSPDIARKPKYEHADCQFTRGNAEPIWEGDGINRYLVMPEDRFTSYSQAEQDRFVHAVLVKPEGLLKGTFVDIGAHHPTSLSNTRGLEDLGWRGWLVEMDSTYAGMLRSERKSEVLEQDARTVDWSHLPATVDYLSLDVDEHSLDALKRLPHDRTRFRIITAEHNAYAYPTLRGPMREFLTSLGYQMVCSDVRFDGNPFEDWWIDPQSVPAARCQRFICQDSEAADILRC